MTTRRLFIPAVLVAIAAGSASAYALPGRTADSPPPAALSRARTADDALPGAAAAAASSRGLAVAQGRRVADGVYLVPATNSNKLCLVTLANNEMRGSCDGSGKFFGGHQFMFTIGEEGSPANPSSVTIAGIARPSVATIRADYPDGTSQDARPSPDGGFSLVIDGPAAADPTKIDALDSTGAVIDSLAGPTR